MTELTRFQMKAQKALDFAAGQLQHLVQTYPDYYPVHTVGGKWGKDKEYWTRWTDGFLPGQLWTLYAYSGDAWFRQHAEMCARKLELRKNDPHSHDLGFIFWHSWKPWYDLTGDDSMHDVLINAGRTLAGRYQERGGYLMSFLGEESLYIDIMMNVGLVYYAGAESDDQDLWQIAHQHCLTTRRYLVRGDGSTAHEGVFEPKTGQFLYQQTRQGWRNDSTWARGQAWALYGFGTAFTYSRDERFLRTAQACADYYMQHTPSSGVPPNDFDEPQPVYPYESSAAGIAASGLLNLASIVDVKEQSEQYEEYAFRILDSLTEPEFLAIECPGWEGILKHGIYHLPGKAGVDESVVWGDYFFLEAIIKALALTESDASE